jgi:hypothetical protein
MASYNINIRTASHISDTVKVEKENLKDLRIEMAKFVGEMLKSHADLIWQDQDWRIDVTDSCGLILYHLDISASDTAATKGTISGKQLHSRSNN